MPELATEASAVAEPAPPGGLVARVMQSLGAHVRAHGLRPGDALPSETALAMRLGISRAAVREGFRSMAALRLIDVGNGRRARVSAIDPSVLGIVLDHAVLTEQATIQQIYDVRRSIELRTAALAAMRSDAREASAIAALAVSMRADFAQPVRVMEHDIAFHEAIAVASRNPMFALLVRSFGVITRQTWGIGWNSRPSDAERMASVQCHADIAAAIAAHDHRAAEQHMAAHFDLSVKALLAAGIN